VTLAMAMARAMADGENSAELWLRAQAPLRGVFLWPAQAAAGAAEARYAVTANRRCQPQMGPE
jgi:hypothetical protein